MYYQSDRCTESFKEIRKDVEIDAYIEHVNYNFLEQHGMHVDIILDATDNF